MNEKVFTPRFQRLRHLEWWLLVLVIISSTIFLAVTFIQLAFDESAIYVLVLWIAVGIFNIMFWHDLLQSEQLAVSPDGISYTNMFGTITSSWNNTKSIERFFLLTRLTFVNKPTYRGSKKWGWYFWLDFPLSRKLRETTIPMGRRSWERYDDLEAYIKQYAPHVFPNMST